MAAPSEDATIRLIGDEELDLIPSEPEFVSLTAEILGSAGTDGDGFNVLFTEAVEGLGAGVAGVLALDPDLSDVAEAEAAGQVDTLTPLAQDFARDVEAGTVIVGELDTLLAEPAPQPIVGGGDGGGGGGGVDGDGTFLPEPPLEEI